LNYVTRYGLPAYLNDEVLPSRDALTAAGYPPVAFAYAFGSHTHAIDDGLLPLFKLVRTTGGDNCLK
jgi:hypothetical protein